MEPLLKPLALLFSFCGLIQALAWFVLSVLTLLANNGLIEIPVIPSQDRPSHNDLILNTIKALYFSDKNNAIVLSVDHVVVLIFASVYTAATIIWALASGLLLYSRHANWKLLPKAMCFYAVCATCVTILDLTLMSMLMADYSKVYDLTLEQGVTSIVTYNLLVIGMMFTLAARGYVLLLLNIVSIVYCVYIFIVGKVDDDDQQRILYNIPIDAYKEYPGDLNFVEAVNEAQTNNGYVPDPWDNCETPQPPAPPQNPRVPLWLSQSAEQSERINQQPPQRTDPASPTYALPAKIPKPPPPMPPPKPAKKIFKPMKPEGKKGPPIPFPDYSPPESPKELRSVIKPTSSYY